MRQPLALAVLFVTACCSPVELAAASVADKATGPPLRETLRQCGNAARYEDATKSECREYVQQGAKAFRSAVFGNEGAQYGSTCIEHNPLYGGRGIDYRTVVGRGRYAQDHGGSTEGAFTFSHKRWH